MSIIKLNKENSIRSDRMDEVNYDTAKYEIGNCRFEIARLFKKDEEKNIKSLIVESISTKEKEALY